MRIDHKIATSELQSNGPSLAELELDFDRVKAFSNKATKQHALNRIRLMERELEETRHIRIVDSFESSFVIRVDRWGINDDGTYQVGEIFKYNYNDKPYEGEVVEKRMHDDYYEYVIDSLQKIKQEGDYTHAF